MGNSNEKLLKKDIMKLGDKAEFVLRKMDGHPGHKDAIKEIIRDYRSTDVFTRYKLIWEDGDTVESAMDKYDSDLIWQMNRIKDFRWRINNLAIVKGIAKF